MEFNKKKLMGILYPIAIFNFIAFCYFALVVCTFYLQPKMFEPGFNLVYSIVILIVFHVIFIAIIYCYLASMLKNPGNPPKFWVSSLGLLHRLPRRKEETLLRHLQQFQARADPPLLHL